MFDGIDNAYPLTPLQEGILYEVLMAPGTDIYVAYVLIDIKGPLDALVFKQAWTAILHEHDTLRTRFVWEELDEPLQLVESEVNIQWETVNALTTVEATDTVLIEQWLQHERTTPLSLSDQPPLRFRLINTGPDRFTLLWTVHHLLADDWSTPIVLNHVLEKYSELAGGVPLAQSERPMPLAFADYVDWVSSADFTASEVWWKENLQGALPTPIAIGHHQGQGIAADDGKFHPRFKHQLDLKTAQVVAKFSTQTGVTQSSLFHAAWALTLSQYAGSLHPMFGTSVSGRTCPLPGIESAVGLFLNTVPTRIHVNPDQSPIAFAQAVQALLFDQMSHEHLPLSVMQTASQDAAATPLFESVLVVESHGNKLNLSSRNSDAICFGEIRYETDSNYPLTLLVFPAERPEVHFLAKASFIDQTLVAQLCDSFVTLLENLCNTECASISEVQSKRQSKYSAAVSGMPDNLSLRRPAFKTMDEWLIGTAKENFANVAVSYKDEQLSYGVLMQRAISVANDIHRHSPQGDCIGVYIGRSIDQIVAVLAVIFCGRGYLALDVEWPERRINQMVSEAACSLIVSQTDHLEPLAGLPVTVLDVGTHTSQPDSELTEIQHAFDDLRNNLNAPLNEQDLAYLMFTSGSTGTPKSVPVSHRNLVYSTAARIGYYTQQPAAYLMLSSLAFDSSVAGVFWTLCTGGTLVLPDKSGGNDVHELAELIGLHQVSHTLCLPSLYALLLQYSAPQKLQSLKTVIVAGEACPDHLRESHLCTLPKTQLYNEYGPTEATVWASVACLHPEPGSHTKPISAVSIGEAIPGCWIEVRNALGEACPAGIIGEIVVSSPGVVAGYRTGHVIENGPFENLIRADENWGDLRSYRSGDLGFIGTNGLLYFTGRVDEQVKIRGYRVEPAEVAWRVERQIEVQAAYCLPTSTQQLICYIVPTGFEESGPCRLIEDEAVLQLMKQIASTASDCIAQELPAYFAVARYIAVSCLPCLPNGKINKRGFPHPLPAAHAPAMAEVLTETDKDSNIANTQTTLQLCQLLEEQLGITDISAQDNFFSLGGDSLSAIRFVARCREQGLELSIPMVSQFSTLHELGQALVQNAALRVADKVVSADIPAYGETPLTPVQRWFFSQGMPKPEHWNMGFTVSLVNDIDCGELTRVIEQVVGSLNVLGTRFTEHENTWAAYVPEAVDVSKLVMCIDEPVSDDAWGAAMADAQQQFDLANGQLLRFLLGESVAGGCCRTFGVVIHHLITDALSNKFLTDLLVRALSSQAIPSVANTSYRSWAIQLSEGIAPMSDGSSSAEVPIQTTWRESGVVSKRSNIDQHLLSDLTVHCQNTGIELHEAILFALMVSVSTQANLQVDMEMHGRDLLAEVVDVSGSIGWYTSFYRLPDCDPNVMQATRFSDLLQTSRSSEQNRFLENPERFFHTNFQTTDEHDTLKLPLLYNFLVNANTGDNASGQEGGGACVRPLLDDRLRHPDSLRSHPVDCIVMDSAVGEIEVLWRIDRDVMQKLDMNAWQSEFIKRLTMLCRNDAGLAKSPEDDFSDSGLDDDELERLLSGL